MIPALAFPDLYLTQGPLPLALDATGNTAGGIFQASGRPGSGTGLANGDERCWHAVLDGDLTDPDVRAGSQLAALIQKPPKRAVCVDA